MWSTILEPGKKYIAVVNYTFNLSMAVLDLKTVKKKKDVHTIFIETEDTPCSILCHLSETLKLVQVKLDLVFPPRTTIKLFTSGSAQIHMTGYLLYDEEEKLCPILESEIIEETTVTENKSKTENGNKRKAEENYPKITKSVKLNDDDEGSDEDFDVNSNEGSDEDSDNNIIIDGFRENQLGNLLDDKGEDSISGNDIVGIKNKSVLTKEEKSQMIPSKKFNENKQKQTKKDQTIPKDQDNTSLAQNTLNIKQALPTSSTEHRKKNDNELETLLPVLRTYTRKVKQNQQFIELSSGVKIQELQIGYGAIVEPGKIVKIYCTNQIKLFSKVLNIIEGGPEFSFVYQHDEVIKGLDIGIAGMKVGGKRRIVCPSKMSLGTKIMKLRFKPRNTLEFEVELLHVGNKQKKTLKGQKVPNSNKLLSNVSTESNSKKNIKRITTLTGLITYTQNVEQNQKLMVLSDGVKIQELLIGDGTVVKPGKNVNIYYTARIKSTGKVFDSMQDGPGLSFAYQRGEVIKGLDIGMAGMKVGGKRRILCPFKMSQGTKKIMKPIVKTRGTLDFEIDLLHVG
ncbi:FK506-binding protein,FKBP-type peptidyl-prolyl cis-trans isomerase domain [Cinara cedri]|uniref:peptidylprolyl isomerase n=1 Tax=Cinara cedri TaxID=506608 RepID=A0A5E4M5B4_9HEMI|nr:FK506-binding protein,FKBP-type peptidyl-prolyl cis-trans isomerase domain [Cinara cedri]